MAEPSWFERVPKLELHLHLEGAIPLGALWELIQKYGGDPSVPDVDALERRFCYRDFTHFLQTWSWKNGFLREYDDFTFIAEEVARDLARQHIRYVEAFYSPGDFAQHGLRPAGITEAIRRGLSRVNDTRVALVADLVRNYGPETGAEILSEIAEVRGLGVIGIGIGGAEQDFPPELFESVYRDARELGLRTSAHAGEAAGAESLWGAIRSLRVDRIGHGTRAEEDGALLDYLAEEQIPLEMCPLSNVCTGVVESLEKHPIRRYLERGIPLSVSTDDPKMFGNSLAEEFRLLHERLGFSHDEIRSLVESAIHTSWLSDVEKRELASSFASDPDWREDPP